MRARPFPLLALVLATLLSLRAGAYIERLYSLSEIMAESTHILVAVVDSVDTERQRATLRVVEDLKGTSGWKKINVNFAVGQFDHPGLMMKRLAPGLPALMFYKAEGTNFAAETHCFGTWFQTHTEDGPDRDRVWWNFTHIEIHLQRTYAGSTPAFIRLVKDVLARRRAAPAPNPQQASGPGPELPNPIPPAELYRPGRGVVAAAPKPEERPPAPPPLPSAAGPAAVSELFTREVSLGHLPGPVLGVTWADVDGDGDPDVYACTPGGNRLYRNDTPPGGEPAFADVTAAAGLDAGSEGAGWADYDGDGRLDLLTSAGRLFRNEGARFREVPLPAGGRPTPPRSFWLDANCDGRPDIVRLWPGALAVLTGGPAGFAPGPAVPTPPETGAPQGFATVGDLNGDGRPDALCAFQRPVLLKNLPRGCAPVLGPGADAPAPPEWPVGVAAGDYDNDGRPDLYLPGRQGGRLLRNLGASAFADVTAAHPDLAALTTPARAACWFDANGDGCLDLFVSREQGPGSVFLNDRTGRLHDRTARTAMAQRGPGGGAAGVAAADFDRDGDPDLLMGSRSGRVLVQVNALARGPAQSYARILPGSLPGVAGARLELLSPAGRFLAHRTVGAVDNFGSQGEGPVLLPARPGAYLLRVRLTTGTTLERPLEVPAGGGDFALRPAPATAAR